MNSKTLISIYIFLLTPTISYSNELLNNCVNYFDSSILKIIKSKVIEGANSDEFIIFSDIDFKFDYSSNSAMAYTSLRDGKREVYFNKSLFKFLCKKQIDYNVIKNVIKSINERNQEKENIVNEMRRVLTNDNIQNTSNNKKIPMGVQLLINYSNYSTICLLDGLQGNNCDKFYEIDIKRSYLSLRNTAYHEIYKNELNSVKSNVFDIILFISFHELGHILNKHGVNIVNKDKINIEFEADNYAFEKASMMDVDFDPIYFDIVTLPVLYFQENIVVEKLNYNSSNIKDMNSCRQKRFQDYIYLLSIYNKLLSRMVFQPSSKEELLIPEEKISFFKILVEKYSNEKVEICDDSTGFINPAKAKKITSYIDVFKDISKSNIKLEKITEVIENSLDSKNIFQRILYKNLILMLINNVLTKNNNIMHVSLSQTFYLEKILHDSINKIPQKNSKLLIALLSTGVLYNKNIPLEKRVQKIKMYAVFSINNNIISSPFLFDLAQVMIIEGNFEKAIEFFQKAIALEEDASAQESTRGVYRLLLKNDTKLQSLIIKNLTKKRVNN